MKRIWLFIAMIIVLISVSSAFAQEDGISLEYQILRKMEGNELVQTLQISGKVPVEFAEKKIGLSLLYPNISLTDSLEDIEKFAALYQGVIRPDGSYDFTFLFEGEEGEYTVILKVDSFLNVFSKTIYITSVQKLADLVKELNEKTVAPSALLGKIQSEWNHLGISLSGFSLLAQPEQAAVSSLLTEYPEQYTIDNFKEIFQLAVLKVGINTKRDISTLKAIFSYYEASHLKLSEKPLYSDYTPHNEKAVLEQFQRLSGNLKTPEEIRTTFFESLFLTKFHSLSFDTQLPSLLEKYRGLIQAEEEWIRYSNLSEKQKRLVSKYIMNQADTFQRMEQVKVSFLYALNHISELEQESAKPQSSGGGASPAGGSLIIAPTETKVPVYEPVEDFSFHDLNEMEWAKESILKLYEMGVVGGKGKNRFCPQDYVTRAEFLKMILTSLNLVQKNAICRFDDVNSEEWYYPYVASGFQMGLVKGMSPSLFQPDTPMTREDISVMLYRIIGYLNRAVVVKQIKNSLTDYDDIAGYAKNSVLMLLNYEIIKGYEDGSFQPKRNLSRAEAAVLTVNLLNYINQ